MKLKQLLLFIVIFMCLSTYSHAQQWSGIIDSARAVNWSGAGVVGGIPNRTTRCGIVIAAYTGTASAINTAISNCPAGQYVELGAGTFTLSTGVEVSKDNVTLRGQGADATALIINGNTGNGCHIGDGRKLNICKGSSNIGIDSPDHTATWSSGYAQGSTTVVLSDHTGMVVGSTLWLDQVDDTSDSTSYPAAGDIWVRSWKGGDSYVRSNRGLTEGHIVTACGTSTPGAACTSNTITISPPVMMPSIRSARSPGAWWGNASSVLQGAGLENLSITGSSSSNFIYMVNCTNCYIKGVKTFYPSTISSGQFRLNAFIQSVNSSVVDSYFYGPQASGLVNVYGIAVFVISNMLFQNNIVHMSVNPFIFDSASFGNVFAYNMFNNQGINVDFSQSSFILHGHTGMNLFEGNNARNFSADNIQTSHNLNTLFRNHFDGTLRNPSGTETQAAVNLYAAARFFNIIGNVMGGTPWSSYQNGQSPPSHCGNCIYEMGWQGTSSVGMATTGNDTNVLRTIMRWGNWDAVNNASRFVSAEVPSGIANLANAVPSSQTLPNSLYMNSKPAWFGSVPFPLIGPDVTGGNITSPATGGHANKIPARICYETTAKDGAGILQFNAGRCYAQSQSGQPMPPTNLTIFVQ